jgi:hypothetical protein
MIQRNNATTQQRNNATTQQRNNATTQQRNNATTQPERERIGGTMMALAAKLWWTMITFMKKSLQDWLID